MVLFSLVADGGQLLAPLRLPRDEGCQVTLLRREGSRFSTLWTYPGFFVPLVGRGQRLEVARLRTDELSLCEKAGAEPSLSYPLWFGGFDKNQPASAALAFRRFLALTESNFAVFELEGADSGRARWLSDFGLHDPEAGSAAVVRAATLVGYGTPVAAIRLLRAYRRWCEFGMPGPAAYSLEVQPATQAATEHDTFLTEVRGDSVLLRRIDPQAGAWRRLIDEADDASA